MLSEFMTKVAIDFFKSKNEGYTMILPSVEGDDGTPAGLQWKRMEEITTEFALEHEEVNLEEDYPELEALYWEHAHEHKKFKVRVTMEIDFIVTADSAEEAVAMAENVELPSGYVEDSFRNATAKPFTNQD